MAAVVIPELIAAGSELAPVAESMLSETALGQRTIGLGTRVISGLEKGVDAVAGVFNTGIESANAFLGTPLGKIVAGGGALAVIQNELRNKNVDIKVQTPETVSNPISAPLSQEIAINREAIKQLYQPKLSKVQQIISQHQLTDGTNDNTIMYNPPPPQLAAGPPSSTGTFVQPPPPQPVIFNSARGMIHGN